nr:DUF4326 domain-containing protein [Sphingomonas tagetis]
MRQGRVRVARGRARAGQCEGGGVTPRRVQLSRAKGWRMPADTVKVDRSTKWGNPYGDRDTERSWRSAAVEAFRLENHRRDPSDFSELRGKNLACWCPLDQPCHADVLLQLANATG